MRVIFMGTPDFAVPALKALVTQHDVIAVYTQPPRPAGKGYKVQKTPVHGVAESAGIPVFCPVSLRKQPAQDEFVTLAQTADVAVVCAYGLILPKAVLEAPRYGCINIHASLLPRWRGAAPIHRAVLAGDTESGVTIMQMDEGLDTGPMLLSERVAITPETTGGLLHDALSEMGARLILKALAQKPAAVTQPETGVTYADKIQKSEAALDFAQPAVDLLRRIRAFNPWPGAYFELSGTRIKVFDAVVEPSDKAVTPGTVLDDCLLIRCGTDALRLKTVQPAGKKQMSAEAFLRGHAVCQGTIL